MIIDIMACIGGVLLFAVIATLIRDVERLKVLIGALCLIFGVCCVVIFIAAAFQYLKGV